MCLSEIRAPHSHLDRRRRAKAHHSADDIAGFKAIAYVRHLVRQLLPEPLFKIRQLYASLPIELHLQNCFFRSACPEIDGVDLILGILHADKPESHANVLRSRLAADNVQRLVGELFSLLDAGACRSAHAQRELSSIDGRKYCPAQGTANNDDNQPSDGEV